MSLPRRISGKVILVISGRSRMMYQSLEPEPEGAILSKRSVPQGSYSTPHDAGASMANWLKTNIQGFVAETLRDKASGRSKLTREPKQIDAQLGKQTGAELSALFVRRCLVPLSGLCRPVWISRMTKPAEDVSQVNSIPPVAQCRKLCMSGSCRPSLAICGLRKTCRSVR